MDQVVHGDDGETGERQRQHVMRRMEQIHVTAARRRGQRDVLGDRVLARRHRHPLDVLERQQRAAVAGAEGDDLQVGTETAHRGERLTDVFADAAVAELANVDSDAHPKSPLQPFDLSPAES